MKSPCILVLVLNGLIMMTDTCIEPVPLYKTFLLKISEQLTTQDVEKIKFIIPSSVIPAGTAESIHNGHQLFTALQNTNHLDADYLCKLFQDINRIDLEKSVKRATFENEYRGHEGLEYKGYGVKVDGGQHYKTADGEYVELRSGTIFKLYVTNKNSMACHLDITIDEGNHIGGWVLKACEEVCIERPIAEPLKFVFYEVKCAPDDSGIISECEANGIIKCEFTPEAEKDFDDAEAGDDFSITQASIQVLSSAPIEAETVQLKVSINSDPEVETDERFTIKVSEEQCITVGEEDFTLETLATVLREKTETFKLTEDGQIQFFLEEKQLNPATLKGNILKHVHTDGTVLTAKVVTETSLEDEQEGDESPNESSSDEGDSSGHEDENEGDPNAKKPPSSPPPKNPVEFTSLWGKIGDGGHGPCRSVAAKTQNGVQGRYTFSRSPGKKHRDRGHSANAGNTNEGSSLAGPRAEGPPSSATKVTWSPGAMALQGRSSQRFYHTKSLQVDDTRKVELSLRLVAASDVVVEPIPTRPPPV